MADSRPSRTLISIIQDLESIEEEHDDLLTFRVRVRETFADFKRGIRTLNELEAAIDEERER